MPLVLFAVATFLGLAIGRAVPSLEPGLALVLLGLGSLAMLVGLRASPTPARAHAIAVVLGVALGTALAPPTVPVLEGERSLELLVERVDDGGAVAVDRLGRRVRIEAAVAPGSTWRVTGELRPRAAFRNTSPHVPWPMLGLVEARVGRVSVLEQIAPPTPYRRMVTALRARLRDGLSDTLRPEAAGVARALVLGDGTAVDEESTAAIRGAGLSHVLAVSGMHVTLVVGALLWAMHRALLRVGWLASRIDVRRVACAIAAVIALAYADAAGSAPSAWRAAVTAALAWTLVAIGRRPSAVGTMAGAAVILAIVDPGAALSPGFVLSIASTAAIVAPRPSRDEAEAHTALRISLRAFVATAPFTLYVFGGMPVVSVLANVVVVPVASALLLPAALVHAVIAASLPMVASVTAPIVETLVSAFLAASHGFAGVSPSIAMPPPDPLQGGVLVLAAVVLLSEQPRARRVALVLALALVYLGLEARIRIVEQPRDVLRVTFLDVGQGDGALIDMPDGRLMAIDVGGAPNGGPDPGERVVSPMLRARRRDFIDWLVITHPHPDHHGGLSAVLDTTRVGEVWDTGQASSETPEGALATTLRTMPSRGTVVRGPRALCGPPRRMGGVLLEVMWPCPRFDAGYDPNDNSLVLRMRYGRRTVLFVGDAEAHTEASLRGRVGRIDVLKVGHHGSRTSSSEGFLAELRPALAIVSCGLGNRFGHPHDEVMRRLATFAGATLRTDLEGSVTVTTDGSRLWADTHAGRHVRALTR